MTYVARNKDFSGEVLRNVKADGWVFVRCNFDRADLSYSSFKETQFIFCSFDRVSWEKSNLEGAKFHKDEAWCAGISDSYQDQLVDGLEKYGKWPNNPPEPSGRPECTARLSSFRRSNLQEVFVDGYTASDSDFSEADLTNASFSNTILNHSCFKNIRFVNGGGNSHGTEKILFGEETSLEFADFSETNLAGIHFKKCKSLEAANFIRADLVGAVFEGKPEAPMSLYRVCFDHVRLSKAEFNHCDLEAASFDSTDLRQIVFLGKTGANAAIFTNAYLAGCQAKGIDFIAANFSGAYISTDEEDGDVPASFEGANLTSANFSDAALIGVNFDNADLTLADFDSATFTKKSKSLVKENKKHRNEINKEYKVMSFNGTTLEKATFRSVNLNGYHFIGCNADGVIFDKAELENVIFINTSLKSCSFDDCYLYEAEFYPGKKDGNHWKKCKDTKLSLESASFVRSALNGAKFYHANLINAEFTGADLNCVHFYHSILIGADFKNSTLERAVFDQSNLEVTNFEQVKFDKAILNLVKLSFAQFLRVRGEGVEIIADINEPTARAVVFRLHDLKGKFKIKFSGAIVEHGSFAMSQDSNVSWDDGLHCIGSSFNTDGKLFFANGVIENSKIDASKCIEISIQSSTVQSSYINGMSSTCSLLNTTLDSCNIGKGWKDAKFEEAKINLTNLHDANSDSDIEKIKLDAIASFDQNSISALRANATSMGRDKGSDHFFTLEKEKEIQGFKETSREKQGYIWTGIAFLILFFVFPASGAIFPVFELDSWPGYLGVSICSIVSAIFFYLSYRRFLGVLYGYGNKLNRIFLSILFIICGFTGSFFFYHVIENKPSFALLLKSFHYSANSFVSIGFWGDCESLVSGPNKIMVLYSNIESFMGIIAIALLVSTMIRRTSGR